MQGIKLPPIATTTDPGDQEPLAPTAAPRLNGASESLKRSGFIAPVNAMTFPRCARLQYVLRRLDERVGAVRDDHAIFRRSLDGGDELIAVGVGNLRAVLCADRLDPPFDAEKGH